MRYQIIFAALSYCNFFFYFFSFSWSLPLWNTSQVCPLCLFLCSLFPILLNFSSYFHSYDVYRNERIRRFVVSVFFFFFPIFLYFISHQFSSLHWYFSAENGRFEYITTSVLSLSGCNTQEMEGLNVSIDNIFFLSYL